MFHSQGVGRKVVGPEQEPRPIEAEPAPAVPGHFVSAEHRTDLQRFLDEVRSLVEHRQGTRLGPPPPKRST